MPGRRHRILCIFVALACVAAAAYALALRMELVVPSWVDWRGLSVEEDLDGDGQSERVSLARRALTVQDDAGSVLYRSDNTWLVSDVIVGDVDADGGPEIAMLVWRRGNYGNSKPFWEHGIDLRMTQHLYVIRIEEGAAKPAWMSHELGSALEVTHMEVPEPGCIAITTRTGTCSTWYWDYFGFTLRE